MRLAFAGGGTGGHIVPGLHLVERARMPSDESSRDGGAPGLTDLLWFTSGRPVEDRILAEFDPPCPWERLVLHLETQGGGAPSLARLSTRTPGATWAARRALKRHRSEVLLGLGGYTALPAALAAISLGIPVALLEINAAPGKVTRTLGPVVQRVFHAWKSTLPVGGEDDRHRHLGAPVSPSVAALHAGGIDHAAAVRDLGFDPERPLLVVLGGSQGAGSLNQFVRTQAAALTGAGLQVLHQCGPGRRSEAPEETSALHVREYVSPVSQALAAATLVLCRGGASTLAEIAAARVPAVVVPYPHHADAHQEQNARQLGDGVRIVADDRLDANLANELLELSSTAGADRRAHMAAALATAAPKDAALEILRELARLSVSRQR